MATPGDAPSGIAGECAAETSESSAMATPGDAPSGIAGECASASAVIDDGS